MGKGRAPCCDKSKVKKGPWSSEEDLKLTAHIHKFGHANWRALPAQAGLLRCGKSCRLRWINYLKPDLKRGNITLDEEKIIINLHKEYGNKWSKIASHLPGRTDNEIKNVWNTYLKKKISNKATITKASNKKKPKKSSVASTSVLSPSPTTSSVSCFDQCDEMMLQDDSCKHKTDSATSCDDPKNLASPSVSCVSNISSFDQVEVPMVKEESVTEIHDGLLQIPADFDMDIWYMLNGMGPIFEEDYAPNDLGLNDYQDSSLAHEFIDRDALKHVEIELGLEDTHTSEENNGSLANHGADTMQLVSGSSCSEDIWTLESSTMAYLN